MCLRNDSWLIHRALLAEFPQQPLKPKPRHTMHIFTLLRIGTIAVRVVTGVALTRRILKQVTAGAAREAVAHEVYAKATMEVVEQVADDGDAVFAMASSKEEADVQASSSHHGRRRLRAVLVQEARAEFGAPRPDVMKGVVHEATRIKVATYLRKLCRDRNVRTQHIAENVDAAVSLYFVPTRRDIKLAYVETSAHVADRHGELARARNGQLGSLWRTFLAALGHPVGHEALKVPLPPET